MASVAALYDIHGNLAALDAVLAEVPDDATIVVGGDICAGGEQPSETLSRLRGLGDRVRWVRGNADRELYPGEGGLVPEPLVEENARPAERGGDRLPPRAARDAADRRCPLLPRLAAQRHGHLHR